MPSIYVAIKNQKLVQLFSNTENMTHCPKKLWENFALPSLMYCRRSNSCKLFLGYLIVALKPWLNTTKIFAYFAATIWGKSL